MDDPASSTSPYELANTPRRRRILDGLRFLGGGPEGFYLDALRILDRPEDLSSASHLVAHCLREVESAIREAFLPVGYERDQKDGEHIRQVTAVLTDLGIPEADPLGQLWLAVAREKTLPERAHRRNLLPARQLDSDARDFVDRLETLFDGVLTAGEARYAVLFQALVAIAAKDEPTKADLAFVQQKMPRNPITLGHFFGALHSPAWLGPLAERDMFSFPPGLMQAEDGRVAVPQWAEGRYLAEVAAAHPETVLTITQGLPQSENPRVYEGVADIALALPAETAVELVSLLSTGLALPFQLLLPGKVADVVVRLSDAGHAAGALDLSAALFRIFPAPQDGSPTLGLNAARSIMNEWDYGQEISKVRPSLVAANPLGSLHLFADLLESAVDRSRPASSQANRDYSDIWRNEISSEQDEHMDIPNTLVSAVAQTAQDIVRAQPHLSREVAAELAAARFPVFQRILLECARTLADSSLPAELLVREDFFESWSPEYQKLIRQEFPRLVVPAQDIVLSWIEGGLPADKVATWLRGPAGREPTRDEISQQIDGWRRHRLEVIGHPLPARWEAKLGHLAFTQPPPELAFGPQRLFMTGSVVGPEPVDVGHMDRGALVAYLVTLGGNDPWSGRGTADVSTAIRQRVGLEPNWPGELDDDFADVAQVMVEAIIDGYGVAFDQGREMPWNQILRSCRWIIGRPSEATGSSDDGLSFRSMDHAGRSILWLLEKGFKNTPQSLPVEDRDLVWVIIDTLGADPDPSSADDAPWDSPYPPGAASLSTVEGAAISSAIEYGKWLDEHSSEIVGMTSVPELGAFLENRLVSGRKHARVVGEVFGRYFPVLWHFDPKWARQNIERIFADDAAGATAWHIFLVFWSAFPEILPHVRHLYQRSLEEFPRTEIPERKADDWARDLAEHLIVYRAWAGLELQDGNLLDTFFEVVPVDLRRHALEFPGFLLSRQNAQPPPAGTIERLMSVWEGREGFWSTSTSTDASEEMRAIGYWFTSEAFPIEWSVEHLIRALELGGQVDNEHQVVAGLALLEDDQLGRAVRALTLMSAADDEGWRILGWGADGHSILERGRRSTDGEVRAAATLLVSRLLRRGYDTFNDLADSGV